jgi:digalactosyldiacylglycerol synthase
MKWLAIRIALAVSFWLIFSASFSSEAKAGSAEQQEQDGGNQSICVASTRRDSSSLHSNDSRTRNNDDIFSSDYLALRVRGGSDEYDSFSYVNNSSVTIVNDDETVEEQDVFFDAQEEEEQETLQLDNNNNEEDEQVVSVDDEPSLPPSISSSLKRRVANRLQRWKKRDGRRTHFLDRMALVSDALLESEHDATLDKEEEDILDTATTHQSDLTRPGRYFTIVTTAALPWMTGTAVNPLLRAAHLVRKTQAINANATEQQWVTLVVPWLELEEDQQELYGRVFANEQEQEEYIRTWLRQDADMSDAADPNTGLKIRFYPARYHPGLKSIFAMGDMCLLIPDEEADVAILEEPEHLNWYRAPGEGWTKKFHYVVGIVHTNYKEYASAHYSGLWTAPAIAVMSSAMVRAYCHKVIKLSDVLQTFAPEKEETSNVHGVRSDFLKEGLRRAQEAQSLNNDVVEVMQRSQEEPEETTVYFIGKLLWAKGLDLMLDLEEYYKQCTGEYFAIDIFGSGPEQTSIMRSYQGRKQLNGNGKDDESGDDDMLEQGTSILLLGEDESDVEELISEESPEGSLFTVQFKTRQRLQKIKDTIKATTESLEFDLPKSLHEYRRQPIPATFPGRIDHALLTKQYKIFVNPSISEVLCTTTAEALAMGKFAIIPVHPSNTFFLRFPNCLAYRNKFEFVANLRWALTHEPEPLSPELAREFTWEAATERFIEASAISHREALEREKLGLTKLDERIAWFHNELGKGVTGDTIRKVLGGGPISKQVKYQRAQQSLEPDEFMREEEISDDEEEESEDDDEGLPRKLRMSSFGAAVRSTVANGLPSLKAGGGSS